MSTCTCWELYIVISFNHHKKLVATGTCSSRIPHEAQGYPWPTQGHPGRKVQNQHLNPHLTPKPMFFALNFTFSNVCGLLFCGKLVDALYKL